MNTDIRTQFHSDSFKKDVICPNCGEEFHGELYKWESGDEECPECDHVAFFDSEEERPLPTSEAVIAVVVTDFEGNKARLTVGSDGQEVCGDPYTHMLYVDTWSKEKGNWVEGDDAPYESIEAALKALSECIKWGEYVAETGRIYEGQFDTGFAASIVKPTPVSTIVL